MDDLNLGFETETAGAAFGEVLRKWTDDELDQAAHDVRDLVDHPGYKALHRLLRERSQRTMRMLVAGKITNEGVYYVSWLKWLNGMEQMLLAPDVIQSALEKRAEKNAKAAEAAERREAA